ncbi:MAG: hotdog fold thioesterase [Bacteroidia bacterium]
MGESSKIWFGDPNPQSIAWMDKNTLSESLNIKIEEIGSDFIRGTMPVDGRTKQPFGLLHGGASVALAETLGSIASFLVVNPDLFIGVGTEINANHIKAVKEGIVTGICKPVHIKGLNHIWEIKIFNEEAELCCISRFTCMIVSRKKVGL